MNDRILWLFGLSINGRRFLHFRPVKTLAAITMTITAAVSPTIRMTLWSIGIIESRTMMHASLDMFTSSRCCHLSRLVQHLANR